ncbi:HalOD1 output domain-containing protein [Haladaptatus halobius]|uniref:HalOD1 output domain-containing protein n=1 Tax=Haladaptatus halobius TaxID=2884875 RepID=UPI001D09B97A|nr:HalOD1 output domain-containing protein [Haladaptatus halobius]
MPNTTDSPPHPRLPDGSGNVSLPTKVVRQVAAEKDVALSTLDPLYGVIEPDALTALFDSRSNGTPRTSGRVVFEYCGCKVIVTSTGDVQTTLLDDH